MSCSFNHTHPHLLNIFSEFVHRLAQNSVDNLTTRIVETRHPKIFAKLTFGLSNP